MGDKNPPIASEAAAWPSVLRRLVIWLAFFALVYLIRDFFFQAFMTFLFSYAALTLVGWCMARLSPDRDRPRLRRLLVLVVFVIFPLTLAGVGALVAPSLISQAQRFAGWISQVNPETEVVRLCEKLVGPAEFRREFGGPDDPRYQKAFDQFRYSGDRHVTAYLDFPKLESWIVTGFNREFEAREANRIKASLLAEGSSSQAFGKWFQQSHPNESAVELHRLQSDPAKMAELRQTWITDAVAQGVAAAKRSPAYLDACRAHYEERQRSSKQSLQTYTFDQFIELQRARTQGQQSFANALDAMHLSNLPDSDAQLRLDFEAAKAHELFEAWWSTSSSATFIRHQLDSGLVESAAGRAERSLSSILNLPMDVAMALLLSFFICIDFPRLSRGFHGLRDTALRDVYDEMVPALSSLGSLVGKAMQAQGLIAACNATLMFLALTFLGVEHAVMLAAVVFVLCLVPTLGMILAWVILITIALVQPGGGIALAAKVTAAVAVVVMLEMFVFSPRILGRIMELHPVVVIALLPLAQYFFGVWGLILATPVAVFVINEFILKNEQQRTAP